MIFFLVGNFCYRYLYKGGKSFLVKIDKLFNFYVVIILSFKAINGRFFGFGVFIFLLVLCCIFYFNLFVEF